MKMMIAALAVFLSLVFVSPSVGSVNHNPITTFDQHGVS